MSKPRYIKFVGGVMDGASMEVTLAVKKVVIQLANNHTLRYENDQIEEYADRTEGRMVETGLPDEFDDELRHDERKGIQ